MVKAPKQFILVEPVAKTPYSPLGLMKIGTMLRRRHRECQIFDVVGAKLPPQLSDPFAIYITSLFTWDLVKVAKCAHFYADRFPRAKIYIGGIAASLLPEWVHRETGITPRVGLLAQAEKCPPDYRLTFGRKIDASTTFASRGCPRRCRFCSVATHEPEFTVRENWERDICLELPRITFWDNNWLASPNFAEDCDKIRRTGKVVDFNQGLDARLYREPVAKKLGALRLNPIRFAFDDLKMERHVLRAIRLAKKYARSEVRVYVLYNFEDTPEDFYYRISLMNRHGVLTFPMEYRKPTPSPKKFPGPHWDAALLRALKLTLIFYYRRGMITESRKSFESIYGNTPRKFVSKLYETYEYDKKLKRKS